SGGVTTVLVLDEAHDADPSVIGLLEQQLTAKASRLLVVTCSWPERLSAETPGSFGAWLKIVPAELVARISLEPLDTDDLATLVTDIAPRTEIDVVQALARRADGNPFVLAGTLDHRRVRLVTREGRIEMDPAEVDSLPSTAREALRARWQSLDEAVREAL